MPSQTLLDQYRDFHDVPPALLKNATFAKTQVEVDGLCAAFSGDRMGYANTANHPTLEGMHPYSMYYSTNGTRFTKLPLLSMQS